MIAKARQKGELPGPSLERAETGSDVVFVCKRGHPQFVEMIEIVGVKQRFTMES